MLPCFTAGLEFLRINSTPTAGKRNTSIFGGYGERTGHNGMAVLPVLATISGTGTPSSRSHVLPRYKRLPEKLNLKRGCDPCECISGDTVGDMIP